MAGELEDLTLDKATLILKKKCTKYRCKSLILNTGNIGQYP